MKEEEEEMRDALDPFTLTIELSHTHTELFVFPSLLLIFVSLFPSLPFITIILVIIPSEISPMNIHSLTVSVPSMIINTPTRAEEEMEEKEE